MKTFASRHGIENDRPYFVLIHSADEPSVHEWNRYVDTVTLVMSSARTSVHAFVATDGGGPNAAQRKALADAFEFGLADAWTHVFTTSVFVRGIVTAFRWIARSRAIAHLPIEFPATCRECGHSPLQILRDFSELQRDFPSVLTLNELADALDAEGDGR
ncbi:MAG TPA: hypothetical protein VHZ95_06980 [Polyangiales bacterium]|nr:hypothetical protein [Polyangiales bacterium]